MRTYVLKKYPHILEACVHALAVEWDHCVGGIADYYAAVFVVIRPALRELAWPSMREGKESHLNTDQRQLLMGLVLLH